MKTICLYCLALMSAACILVILIRENLPGKIKSFKAADVIMYPSQLLFVLTKS